MVAISFWQTALNNSNFQQINSLPWFSGKCQAVSTCWVWTLETTSLRSNFSAQIVEILLIIVTFCLFKNCLFNIFLAIPETLTEERMKIIVSFHYFVKQILKFSVLLCNSSYRDLSYQFNMVKDQLFEYQTCLKSVNTNIHNHYAVLNILVSCTYSTSMIWNSVTY